MKIADRIKARRLELGMTQDELAKKLGYKGKSSINKIEGGSQDLPQKKIELIAKALDTTPEYIMGWTEVQESAKKNDAVLSFEEEKILNAFRSAGSGIKEAVGKLLDVDLAAAHKNENPDAGDGDTPEDDMENVLHYEKSNQKRS